MRSHFKDVRRGYERLEQAFFAADRRDHDPSLYSEINLLSNVFTSLSDEFYYVGLGGQGYGPAYNSTYSGNSIISSKSYGSRNSGLRHSGSRELDPRRGKYSDYDRRDHEPRSNSRIVPNRQNAIPPLSRGNSGGVASGRQNGRDDQGRSQGQRAGKLSALRSSAQ